MNVRRDGIDIVRRETLAAIPRRYDRQTRWIPLGYRQLDVTQTQFGRVRDGMLRKLVQAGRESNIDVDSETTSTGEPALIRHAIAGAEDRFVLTSPGYIPTQPDSGSKIVPIVLVKRRAGIRRTFSTEFYCCQLAALSRLVPIREAGAG